MNYPNDVNGPWLQIAAFCERILEEKDGVQTPLRIVDSLTYDAAYQNLLPSTGPAVLSIWAFIAFKSGGVPGRHRFRFHPDPASGIIGDLDTDFEVGGYGTGASFPIQLPINVRTDGRFWFDVFLDERLVTRMPLAIRFWNPNQQIR